MRALDDVVKIVDQLAFKIDLQNREELLKVVNSCIATKLTRRFGALIPVRPGTLQCVSCTFAIMALQKHVHVWAAVRTPLHT